MHTVLLLTLHQRSSAHTHTHTHTHRWSARSHTLTQMDTTHLMFSTPLSPICLRLFLCSPLSCAHKHCCHCDRHKHRNTHHQLSVSMHTQTDTHEIRIFMPFRQDVLNFCVSFFTSVLSLSYYPHLITIIITIGTFKSLPHLSPLVAVASLRPRGHPLSMVTILPLTSAHWRMETFLNVYRGNSCPV